MNSNRIDAELCQLKAEMVPLSRKEAQGIVGLCNCTMKARRAKKAMIMAK